MVVGRSFGLAFCKYFNLNPSDVLEDMTLTANYSEAMTVNCRFLIDEKDLKAIALLMETEDNGRVSLVDRASEAGSIPVPSTNSIYRRNK